MISSYNDGPGDMFLDLLHAFYFPNGKSIGMEESKKGICWGFLQQIQLTVFGFVWKSCTPKPE